MSERCYFSYDPDGDGFQDHSTAKEAEGAAQSALEGYAGDARSDGWPEWVGGVCWGQIIGQATQTSRRTREDAVRDGEDPEDIDNEFGEWDEIVGYTLVPVPEPPLSTRDPLAFLAVIAGQLAAAVIAVDTGTAPEGWKRSGPGYQLVRKPNDGPFVSRGAAAFGYVWSPSVQDDGADLFDPPPSFRHGIEAIWHAEDPDWIDRVKAESAAWTGNREQA